MNFDVAGSRVVSVRQDFQVHLSFIPTAELTVEGPFDLVMTDGRRHRIHLTESGFSDPTLDSIVGATVERAWVEDDVLHLELADGRAMIVPPLDQYESWNFATPGRSPSLVVSTPGGELAVW